MLTTAFATLTLLMHTDIHTQRVYRYKVANNVALIYSIQFRNL